MPEKRVSRRKFGAALAATATLPANLAAQRDSPSAAGSPSEQESELTPELMAEMETRYAETVRRFGDRLSEEQRERIRRVLTRNERMLASIRDFPLGNGDTPATVLKLRDERK